MRDHTAISLWGLMDLGIGWAAAVYFGDNTPPSEKPVVKFEEPAATCMVTQPQWLTPDVFVTPWRGALTPSYPCKLLKKEQDV